MLSCVTLADDVQNKLECSTYVLCAQVELKRLARNIGGNIQQTELIDETLARDIAEGQKVEMSTQKLGQIVHVSQERFNRMVSRTVVQELRDVLDTQQESDDASVSPKTEEKTLAEVVSLGRFTHCTTEHSWRGKLSPF